MKQAKTSKKVVSMLMALTMLLSMMTVVTVGAETADWTLVKEFTFEGNDPLKGLDQTTNGDNKDFEVIKDSTTGSMVAHIKFTTDVATKSRIFNVLNVMASVGDEFRVEYDIKAKFVDETTEFKWSSCFLAGGTTAYAYFNNKQATAEWQSHSTELRAAYNPVKEEALLTNPYNCQMGLSLNGQAIGDEVWIDNVRLYKKVTKPEVTVTITDAPSGTVTNGQAAVASGDKIAVNPGEDLTLNIAPVSGYYATVKVNGNAVTPDANNQITLEDVTADATVDITFSPVGWELVKFVDFENITKTGADSKGELDFIIYARANSYECVVDETGSKVLHLVGPSSGTTMNFFIRDVPMEKGAVYKSIFRAKAKRNASITDPMRLILYMGSYYLTPHGTLTDQWQTIERNGNADGYTGETTAAGALTFENNPANGTTAVQSDDELWIDDIKIYKKIVKNNVTVTANAGGSVTYNGNPVTEAMTVTKGTEVTLTAVPEAGYSIDAITVGGEAVEHENGAFTFTVTADTEVNVSFKKIANDITVIYGDGGSVTCNGEAVTAPIPVAYGETLTLTVAPDEGYFAKVMQGDQELPVTNGTVTLENVTEATTVTVTFTKKPDAQAGIATGVTYEQFTQTDLGPTIFIYSKLNNFTLDGNENLNYGIKLWNVAYEEDVAELKAYDPDTKQPAIAVANAPFAIRAYGAAITADQAYAICPFVGETEGETLSVTFNE